MYSTVSLLKKSKMLKYDCVSNLHMIGKILYFVHIFQDDAVCQMRNLGTQYKELEQERERTENRLQQLTKSMCEVEEGELLPLNFYISQHYPLLPKKS